MNFRLAVFMLISVLIHIFLFQYIKLDVPEQEKKPISVDIIKKEKEPQPVPEPPKPEPKREKTPVRENPPEPDSKIDESEVKVTPDDTVSSESHESGKKNDASREEKRRPDTERGRQENRPAPPSDLARPELPPMDFPERVPMPKEPAPMDRDKVDRILNPRDIINDIAKNGGEKEGEDSVSMQEVKTRYTSYFYKFRRLLYQTWAYPAAAAMNGEQGTVRIRFSIQKDGRITDIELVSSSGYPDLDNEAVRALRHMGAAPLPNSYKLNVLRVDGYFVYYISGGFDIY
jgi:protein TonB